MKKEAFDRAKEIISEIKVWERAIVELHSAADCIQQKLDIRFFLKASIGGSDVCTISTVIIPESAGNEVFRMVCLSVEEKLSNLEEEFKSL